MTSGYPWYTRATDIAHRVTVLSLVGFTLYMSGAVVYTLWSTGKENEKRLTIEKTRRAAIAEQRKLDETESK
ncbi:hypothetical protein FOA43_002116 [Brettanomyces nanus]|uniref:Uncharacterized protein n=1 Tax=Eeniella nana TaxID=13502 RepID=A0A875S3Z3_EENNA|nr:uncharacterized protein FOA43_002116 [Brettanomyces nanus]QPG74782.1 hypothetical protein FOA43_002116 [Brettanomyces nanus]